MTPPPEETGLNSALERNIGALRAHRRREDATARFDDRVSDAITGFAGSLAFVYVHVALVSVWTAVNLGLVPGVVRFDPTFVILATVASVEAIFLSTFVLISQNRAAERANRRDELDLHINLLTEHEVTRLLALTRRIAHHLEVPLEAAEELEELERDVAPERILDTLDGPEGKTRQD